MSRYTSKHTGPVIDAAIDRAKAGGAIDTTLQNNDPRRWGLGGNAVTLTSGQNLNDIQTSGLYGCYKNAVLTTLLNRPPYDFDSGEVEMLVVPARANTLVQIIHNNYGGITAVRDIRGASAVGEWEYVNPPMQIGIEYRTTERYLGKPVYAYAFNFDAMPSANSYSNRNAPCKNVEAVIDCRAINNTNVMFYPRRNFISATDKPLTIFSAWPNGIDYIYVLCTTDSEGYSGQSATVLLKYTKTTD